jgi:tetratricopeptide (TPR) repeat protein
MWRDVHEFAQADGGNYSYEILKVGANACWNDQLPLDTVLNMADTVFATMSNSEVVMARATTLLVNLARKKETTSELRKYLQAGLKAVENTTNPHLKDYYTTFQIEWALNVDADTAKAIMIKKRSLPAGWEENPSEFFSFARFCLERKINLPEAEEHARRAAQRVRPGPTSARVYSTLARICFEQGKVHEARAFAEEAVVQDSHNPGYLEMLEKYQAAAEEAGY